MAKVLLTHSYYLRLDPKQWEKQEPYPPLGTLWAVAALREHGHEVHFHDVMFQQGPEHFKSVLANVNPDFVVVYDDGFNYLTKMCLTNMRDAAFAMAGYCVEAETPCIISSSDSTDHSQDYLNQGYGYVVIGEGEQTLKDLIAALESGGSATSIPGIRYLSDDGNIEFSGPRQVMKELDQLPLPAWDLLDFKPYQKAWKERQGYFSLNIATTRGCPYKCNWCAKPIYGNRYNTRSPEHVVRELLWLKELANPDHLWVCDDIFGLKPGWVGEFADLCQKHGLRIPYKIQSRADLLCRENETKALALSGCEEVWIGAESGSQKILDAMDKGITLEQIAEATASMKRHGISPAFFLQFGYPGESREDIQLTLDMVQELVPDQVGVSVSYPLPGTKFYESVKSELGEKSNWSDSDELLLMFKNTYPPEFYKKLQRHVHHLLRRKKGTQILKGEQFKWKDAALYPYFLALTLLESRSLSRYHA